MTSASNVNRVKPQAGGRTTGLKVFLISLAAAAAGTTPLLLYILLGPADGNPIGLGLLAAVSLLAGGVGALIGAVTLAVEFFTRPRS